MDCVKRGMPLTRQAKVLTLRIYKQNLSYANIQEEKAPVKVAVKKTAELVGISQSMIYKILKEHKETGTLRSPNKKVAHRHWITDLDDFDFVSIKKIIYSFHQVDKKVVTLSALMQKIHNELEIKISKTSLWRALKTKGFHFRKTEDNRKVLCEKTDIRLQRIKYIRQIKNFRERGYQAIYIDESYIHSSSTQPIGNGSRLKVLHAGGSNGYVKDALLIFKCGAKADEYNNKMNSDNFAKWLREQVLQQLNEPSVIVMEKSLYHKLKDGAPTSSASTFELISWLTEHNVAHSSLMLKFELYDLVKKNKTLQHPIDLLIRTAGHEVLRLPPHHPDLNPIKNIWSTVKSRVADRNTTSKLDDVKKIAQEEFAKVTLEEWKNTCCKAALTEDNYLSYEQSWDAFTDGIVFRSSEDSSSEMETDED